MLCVTQQRMFIPLLWWWYVGSKVLRSDSPFLLMIARHRNYFAEKVCLCWITSCFVFVIYWDLAPNSASYCTTVSPSLQRCCANLTNANFGTGCLTKINTWCRFTSYTSWLARPCGQWCNTYRLSLVIHTVFVCPREADRIICMQKDIWYRWYKLFDRTWFYIFLSLTCLSIVFLMVGILCKRVALAA